MKKVRRPRPRFRVATALLLSCFAAATGRALDAEAWKHRQTFAVEAPGVLRIALPPATLDLARPGLEDVRLLDPSGRETPFIIETSPPVPPSTSRAPQSFRNTLVAAATVILIETGSAEPLAAITLVTPAPDFIKSARVELSADGVTWETISPGAPIFRQFGTEQLRLPLDRRRAARVRVTIDDSRTPPIPFTGATVLTVPGVPPVITRPLDVRLLHREEFAGETVLTLDLGAARVPLASFAFVTGEPLFARRLAFTVRELRAETSVERTLATGSIYRIAAEGLPPGAQLEIPVDFTAPSRELLVRITNGDSPPLPIDRIDVRQRPRWLLFRAAVPGLHTLLTGNADCPAPRYDLAALAPALSSTPASAIDVGPATANPGFRRSETLADAPAIGAAIDLAPWRYFKPVELAGSGVHQLELDLDIVTRSPAGLADLRLVRAGHQLPYLVEQPGLFRKVPLTLTPLPAPEGRPNVGRWSVALPRPGFRLGQLTLTSTTPLFQRPVRLLATKTDPRGAVVETTLAETNWIRISGGSSSVTLTLPYPTDTAPVLEIDHGDNAPIALASAATTYPVARLLFNASGGPLALHYGNAAAISPRYDLALIAGQIFASEKIIAHLGGEVRASGATPSGSMFAGLSGGPIFWAALAAVVTVLLVVIARLLPKPPAA